MLDQLRMAEGKVISMQDLEVKLRKGVSEKKDLLISEFLPLTSLHTLKGNPNSYTRRERTMSVDWVQGNLGVRIGDEQYSGYYSITCKNVLRIIEDKEEFYLIYMGGNVQKITLKPRLFKKDFKLDVTNQNKWEIKQATGYSSNLSEFYNWVQGLIGHYMKISTGKDVTNLNAVRSNQEELTKQGIITKVYGNWNDFCIELDGDFKKVERFNNTNLEAVNVGSHGTYFIHRSCQYRLVRLYSTQ
ncbi:hypothetical protein P9X10_02390 [Bacillus cereus]|nr:hypothetical protein [Bacillus cereus]